MSETPEYTDDDLKDAAATAYAALIADAERVRVGELIADDPVTSLAPQHDPADVDGAPNDGDGVTWSGLLEPEGDHTQAFGEATERVHGLVTGAADLAPWAIQLGADGLTPSYASVDIAFDGTPGIRVLFALNSEVIPEEHHNKVVARLAAGLAEIAL